MSLKFKFLFAFLTIIIKGTCAEKGTLAFVVDDTGSMSNEINIVKSFAMEVLQSITKDDSLPIQDVAVVTFNDPDVKFRTRTRNSKLLKKSLDLIYGNDGGDCPEMALSGIKKALEKTRPGSHLYVITDASAKDTEMFGEVEYLCQKKKSQVSFFLTGSCGEERSINETVYTEIASKCGGATYKVSKEALLTSLSADFAKFYGEDSKEEEENKRE